MNRVPRPGRVVLGVGVLALALVLAGALAWWLRDGRTDFEQAVSLAPEGTARYLYTDWAGVRAQVSDDRGEPGLDRLLDRGHSADLTSASVLADSAPALADHLGFFSPLTVDWELYAQSEEHAMVLLGMPDDTDFDELESGLRNVGYSEPDGTGVWVGDIEELARLGQLTADFAFVALDRERALVIASDTRTGAEAGLESARADEAPGDGVQDVTASLGGFGRPLSAVLYDGEQACSELAMAGADEADRQYAEQLVEEAGGVHPLRGFAMGLFAPDDLRVAMSFETESQARADADARSELAAGAAPGQGGDFAERFRLGDVTAQGRVVQLEMTPERNSYAFSDLSSGPLLFATC